MDGFKGALAYSLQFRLSLWLAAAIVVIAALAGAWSFDSALADVHQAQDNQLRQTGFLISRLDTVPASPLLARERAGDVDFDARVVVRFLPTPRNPQIANPGRPPVFAADLADGLQTVSVGPEQWRVFVRTSPKGVRVAVGQQTTVRDAAARASAIRTLMPILFLAPVLLLLVAVLLRQMFKPFRTLAEQLARRHENDLGALSESGLPSEVWLFVAEINMLLERMRRSLAVQRRFIADAAHELRSPLTAMSLQAERLSAAEMPGEARIRLNALSAGLQRTRFLGEQLLTLAKAQQPSLAETGKVSLREVIRDVVEDLVPIAHNKRIDLGVIGETDASIEARFVDVKIMVKNLLDNAVRYTPDGGQVDVTLERDDGLVTLQVDDTGPGIPGHLRERVFDSFYRVVDNGEVGSGLGLAITRTVADNLEATIELGDAHESQSGLRVRVTFREARNE